MKEEETELGGGWVDVQLSLVLGRSSLMVPAGLREAEVSEPERRDLADALAPAALGHYANLAASW